MNFRDYWLTRQDGGLMPHVDVAEDIWKTAQAAERERTTAIMLKHLAQWNVPWSESVDKAVNEINELDT